MTHAEVAKEAIWRAFSKTPCPPGDALTVRRGTASVEEDLDIRDTVKFFGAHLDRVGLDLASLRYESAALYELTNESLVYFLPAYLTGIIDDPEAAGILTDMIEDILNPAARRAGYRGEIFFLYFDKQERDGVRAFVDFVNTSPLHLLYFYRGWEDICAYWNADGT